MTSVSTNPSGTSFPKVSKERVLNTFKTPRNPITSYHRLFDVFNEIFSKIALEPENNLPPKEINPSELFVEAVATPKPMRLVTQKRVVIPKSPFTSSGYSEDPASRVWYYLDESSNVQGPFTCMEMDHWFDNDFLSHELLIRLKEKNDFVKLINLFGKTEVYQTYKTGPYGTEQSPYPPVLDSSDKKHSVYTFEAEGGYAQSPYSFQQKSQYSFDVADESLQDKVLSPARLPSGVKSALTPNQKSTAPWAVPNQSSGFVRNVNESPQSNKFAFGSQMANSPARK